MICSKQNTIAQDTTVIAPSARKTFKPLPMKATMLSAVLPGFGQIYNRKYWKIPLVYAGFGGFGLGVVYNTKFYNMYVKAYQDFTDKIKDTDSYVKLLPGSDQSTYDPVVYPETANLSQAAWIKDQLLFRIDYYKNYRDLSYIGIVAWYILSVLDANVDASLFDYDIGRNLNLAMVPVQMPLYYFSVVGVNVSLKICF